MEMVLRMCHESINFNKLLVNATLPFHAQPITITRSGWFRAGDFSGGVSGSVQFTEYVQKNVHLYKFKNNMPLSTAATANFTRGKLATALRKVLIRFGFLVH